MEEKRKKRAPRDSWEEEEDNETNEFRSLQLEGLTSPFAFNELHTPPAYRTTTTTFGPASMSNLQMNSYTPLAPLDRGPWTSPFPSYDLSAVQSVDRSIMTKELPESHTGPPNVSQQPEPTSMTVEIQPAMYQITNYNVHPAPLVRAEHGYKDPLPIQARLVECSSGFELSEGFQGSCMRDAPPQFPTANFSGLKLNKMGIIKKELQDHHVFQLNGMYFIRFSSGRVTCDTDEFHLLSSYSQLPADSRDRVRRTKHKGNDHKD